jgi:hypothetical protein
MMILEAGRTRHVVVHFGFFSKQHCLDLLISVFEEEEEEIRESSSYC